DRPLHPPAGHPAAVDHRCGPAAVPPLAGPGARWPLARPARHCAAVHRGRAAAAHRDCRAAAGHGAGRRAAASRGQPVPAGRGRPLTVVFPAVTLAFCPQPAARAAAVTLAGLEFLSLGGHPLVDGTPQPGIILPWHWLESIPVVGSALPDRFSIIADGMAAV